VLEVDSRKTARGVRVVLRAAGRAPVMSGPGSRSTRPVRTGYRPYWR